MGDRSLLLFPFLILASCSTPSSFQASAVPRPGDPALDGKDYLVSDAEFREVVAFSRDYVARHMPSYAVRRIHVMSRDKIEVYVRESPARFHEFGDVDFLEVQRINGKWKVTADKTRALVWSEGT
jgi:hypothetical protein